MTVSVHMTRIQDTWANIQSDLDAGQTAILTDQANEHVWLYDSKYFFPSMSKYYSGGFVYLDTTHDDITAQGIIYASEYIQHNGDTDTGIRLRDDRVTIFAGSVDMLDCVEGINDYMQALVDIFMEDDRRIRMGGAFGSPGITMDWDTSGAGGESFNFQFGSLGSHMRIANSAGVEVMDLATDEGKIGASYGSVSYPGYHFKGASLSGLSTDEEFVQVSINGDYGAVKEKGIYGEIYLNNGTGSTAVASGAGYTKIDQFLSNGQSSHTTPDAANDKIIITVPGEYLITGAASFGTDTNNVNVYGAVFLDGVEQDNIHFQRKIATGADIGAAAFSGHIYAATVPVDVDFRVRHDLGSPVDFDAKYLTIAVDYRGAV